MANPRAAVLLLPLLLGACARNDDTKSSAPLNKYSIHGEIMRLNDQDKTATIHHKDIVGFMKSMTMTFPVKDPKEFAALQTGNCIEGTLFEQGDDLWVGDIQHLDLTPEQCVPPPPPDADQKK
jgi:Cu/Ag efflux protein CusF